LETNYLEALNKAARGIKSARQTNLAVVRKLRREGRLGLFLAQVLPISEHERGGTDREGEGGRKGGEHGERQGRQDGRDGEGEREGGRNRERGDGREVNTERDTSVQDAIRTQPAARKRPAATADPATPPPPRIQLRQAASVPTAGQPATATPPFTPPQGAGASLHQLAEGPSLTVTAPPATSSPQPAMIPSARFALDGSNFAKEDQLLPSLDTLGNLRVAIIKRLSSVKLAYHAYKSDHLKCLLKHTAGPLIRRSDPRFVARLLGATTFDGAYNRFISIIDNDVESLSRPVVESRTAVLLNILKTALHCQTTDRCKILAQVDAFTREGMTEYGILPAATGTRAVSPPSSLNLSGLGDSLSLPVAREEAMPFHRQTFVPGAQHIPDRPVNPPLDVGQADLGQLENRQLKDIIEDRNVLNSSDVAKSAAKKELIRRFFGQENIHLLNFRQLLQLLKVPNIHNHKDRQKEQLMTFAYRNAANISAFLRFLQGELAVAKRDLKEKVQRIVTDMNSVQVHHLLVCVERILGKSSDDRPVGTPLRSVLEAHLLANLNNPALAEIFASSRFARQDSDHIRFPRWEDEEAVLFNRNSMKGLHQTFLNDGHLVVEGNPSVDALSTMHQRIRDEIRLPDNPCSNCEGHDLDIVVKVVRGQPLCNLCSASATRARKFGLANAMVPGDQPDQLQDLTMAETAAISLVLPVVQVFRQGTGLRMRGHSISFPQDLEAAEVLTHLPRLPADLNLIYVKAPGPAGQSAPPKVLEVRRDKIQAAISWLQANNPYYRDIQLDREALNAYPEHGALDLPGYELPPHTLVQTEQGPAGGQGDEADDPAEATAPTFEPSMRLGETGVGALQPDLVIAQMQAMMRGATRDNPLDWAQQGRPTSERQPGFWAKAFPTLFCNGQAGYALERPHHVSREDWLQHLLRHKSGRFAANTTFVFFAFAFLQKERAWSLGNIYAKSARFTTKAALQAELDAAGPDQLRQIAQAVARQSARMPGTNAYHKTYGEYCASHILFQRHFSRDTENYNVFLTISAADHHWPAFYRLFPEGRRHLAKTLVANETEVPQGGNRCDFVTSSEDFLFRKRFLIAHAHHFDLFFRKQLDLLFTEVLEPVMGVTDHIIRYEYQSRGAIHAHIMMVVPMGVSEQDRIEAWTIVQSRAEDFGERVHADLLSRPGEIPLLSDLPPGMPADERQQHIRFRILQEFVLGCGAAERHPSGDLNDWFVADGGSLTTAPSSECLRQDWETRLANPRSALINLVNKVGTHTCSTAYCKKPDRQTVIVDGAETVQETARDCRFGYPRDLVGFRRVLTEEGEVSVSRTEAPVANGWIGRTEADNWPVLRVRRNHPRTTSYSPFLLLGIPCNQDIQYVPTLAHLRRYVAKYISKTEPSSRSSEDFAREVLDTMAPEDEVRKFCQKIIKQCTADHDYSLPEVHLYANQGEAFKFSRDMKVLNVLNDRTFDFSRDAGEAVIRRSTSERYDLRHEEAGFQRLVEHFEEAEQENNLHGHLLSKHPDKYSLFEYVACFTPGWVPLHKFKVVHLLPAFKERPSKQSSPEWYTKFLLTTIRAHFVPNVATLAQLQTMSDEELFAYGNPFFESDDAPIWASELWSGHTNLTTVEDVIPLIRPDEQPEDDDDHRVIGDGLQDGLAAESEDEDADTALALEEHATRDYDKSADKLAMAPDWDHARSARFRAGVRLEAGNDEDANPRPLPHDALNPKQALLVKILGDSTRRVLQNQEQFFLEVCGSAGTGKTAALLRYLADTREILRDHPTLSVGRFLLFSAATGAAVKLLPKPAKTLHTALNLPLTLKNNAAMERLSPTTLGILQDQLRDLAILLIDEKSFVGCRFLHNIHLRLQQIKDEFGKPFGGVSIVLIGDFKQLSPVGDLPLWTRPDKVRMSIYQRLGLVDLYQACFKDVVVLEENMRQAGDPVFQGLIRSFLAGTLDEGDWATLSRRSLAALDEEERGSFQREAVMLCSLRRNFEPHNINKIVALATPRFLLEATNEPASGKRFGSNAAGGLPRHILLTRGMRVMLTANTDLGNGLSNGSIGTVVGVIFINPTDDMPEVFVQFDGYTGRSCLPNIEGVYPIGPITRSWMDKRVTYKRTMIPLAPAYGFSIHKSQGQTLSKVVLNLGDRDFAAGLTYTALTRSKGLSNMAFAPMPTLGRLQSVMRSATFKTQLADDQKKLEMERVMLTRLPDLGAFLTERQQAVPAPV